MHHHCPAHQVTYQVLSPCLRIKVELILFVVCGMCSMKTRKTVKCLLCHSLPVCSFSARLVARKFQNLLAPLDSHRDGLQANMQECLAFPSGLVIGILNFSLASKHTYLTVPSLQLPPSPNFLIMAFNVAGFLLDRQPAHDTETYYY